MNRAKPRARVGGGYIFATVRDEFAETAFFLTRLFR
jgi:hypothetical protein